MGRLLLQHQRRAGNELARRTMTTTTIRMVTQQMLRRPRSHEPPRPKRPRLSLRVMMSMVRKLSRKRQLRQMMPKLVHKLLSRRLGFHSIGVAAGWMSPRDSRPNLERRDSLFLLLVEGAITSCHTVASCSNTVGSALMGR
jgi:hypothetical protein